MKKLGKRNYLILKYGVQIEGCYDPEKILPAVEEELLVSQIDEIESFLEYVHKNDRLRHRKFMSRNWSKKASPMITEGQVKTGKRNIKKEEQMENNGVVFPEILGLYVDEYYDLKMSECRKSIYLNMVDCIEAKTGKEISPRAGLTFRDNGVSMTSEGVTYFIKRKGQNE